MQRQETGAAEEGLRAYFLGLEFFSRVLLSVVWFLAVWPTKRQKRPFFVKTTQIRLI